VRHFALFVAATLMVAMLAFADDASHTRKKTSPGISGAPQSAHGRTNPYDELPDAMQAGEKLFERHCAECHGSDAQGIGKAPRLRTARIARALPGDLFWFLTNGDLRAGMPSWSRLPEQQRWQLVSYLKSLRERPVQPAATP
jgi:mono/diheme cytochrome c family protein